MACAIFLPHWLVEADLDARWRIQKVRGRSVRCFGAGALGAALKTLLDFAVERESHDTVALSAGVAVVLAAAACLLARIPTRRSRIYELVEFIACALLVVFFVSLVKADEEPMKRVRRQVGVFFTWFLVALFIFLRVRYFLMLTALHLALHVRVLAMDTGVLGLDEPSIRVIVYLLGATMLCAVMGISQGLTLRSFQRTEMDLRQEQQAMNSLVSMLCDGSCVVDADGDTVVHADPKFNHLLGREMAGQSLNDVVASDDSDGPPSPQVTFFRETFRRVAQGDALLWAEGGAVPVLLRGAGGARVPATLFVVARRGASTAAEDGAVSFLVGVTQTVEEERLEVLDKPQAGAWELEALGELPSRARSQLGGSQVTELTANIFEMGASGEVEALERVLELGRREHWLVREDEVSVEPRVLGAGTFGCVLPGRFYGAPVAVKLVRSHSKTKDLRTLVHELRILRRCRHPNLVQFEGALFDMRRCRMALVLEYASGGDLGAWRLQDPAPSQAALHLVALDVCSGLWYLHSRSPAVVHGDLKCGNILVLPGPEGASAKLADFGQAALFEEQPDAQKAGTLRWTAPEVVRRERPAHPLADVFSFGRVVDFLVTGELPYRGVPRKVVREDLASNRVMRPPPPSDAGARWRDWLAIAGHCLVEDWQRRPFMTEIRSQLLRLQSRPPNQPTAAAISEGSGPQLAWPDFLAAHGDKIEGSHAATEPKHVSL